MNYIEKFPSDSKVWGPGVWWTIHIKAIEADRTGNYQDFIDYMNLILPKLPCMTCREHATEYLANNSPYDYIRNRKGNHNAAFEWTFYFHNNVRNRLGQPIINDVEVAKNLYDEDEFCTAECGN